MEKYNDRVWTTALARIVPIKNKPKNSGIKRYQLETGRIKCVAAKNKLETTTDFPTLYSSINVCKTNPRKNHSSKNPIMKTMNN